MIDMVLGANSQCSALGEFIHFHKYGMGVYHCHTCGLDCEHWKNMALSDKPTQHQAAFDVFQTPVLSDSSKTIEYFQQVMADNPSVDFRLVCLKRYGLATFRKHHLEVKAHPIEYFRHWATENVRMDVFASSFPPDKVMWLRYEDFIAEPKQNTKRLCELAGMEYEEGQERFWEKMHHVFCGNGSPVAAVRKFHNINVTEKVAGAKLCFWQDDRWKSLFPKKMEDGFRQIAGNVLEGYGYL